jgi:beta-galactosidase
VLRPLVATCHAEDPTRPVTAACDRVFDDSGGAKLDFLSQLDIVGYNYADRWRSRRETVYSDDHQDFPQRKMVGSESVCIGGVRGNYHFAPIGADQLPRAVYATDMIRAEQLWKFVAVHDYVLGDFLWTGIDYLGESRWPDKAATSGVLDTCGFPKDSYYFYQSVWAAQPMLHLLPHWNWPGREGQIIPVIAYTSCDSVELFLNGKSLGVKAREFPRQGTAGGWNKYARPEVFPTTADLHLSWDVPYEPGVLKAVGYQAGQKVCAGEIRTAGAPAAIVLSADRETLHAGTRDVAHLFVKIVDAHGNVVPGADNLVKFEVGGAGTLLGVDSGNPASHESYQAGGRKTFDGLALALVQSGFAPGELRVTATAENLNRATVNLRVIRAGGTGKTLFPSADD